MSTPNTLEGLRATLDDHAEIHDRAIIGRGASVRHRVQVVRRRRRTAAATGALATVLLLVAGVGLSRVALDRADSTLPAATTVTVGGFDYRLVKVVQTMPGRRSLHIGTPRGGSREAFALLAEHLDGGSATLRSDNVENRDVVDRIVRSGANPAVPVFTPLLRAGTPGPYRLTLAGGSAQTRVGVAIYERTAAIPAGVVDHAGTTVFRRTIGSRHLLTAAFAEPGHAEVSFRFTGRVSQTALEGFCSIPEVMTGPPPFVNVSIDGGGAVSSAGCVNRTEDAASGGFISDDPSTGSHTVRVWTSTAEGGAPHVFPRVILGGAAYDDSAAVTIDGSRVDPVVEYEGRTWRLDQSATLHHSGPGHSLSARPPAGGPVLFGYTANRITRIRVSPVGTMDDGSGTFTQPVQDAGPFSSVGEIGSAGSSYTVSWPAKDTDAQVSILVYRPEK